MSITFPGEFQVDETWRILRELLRANLDGVDVDTIGKEDFDEEGALTLRPPCVRLVFLDENAKGLENQNMNYEAVQGFAAMCADKDLGADPQDQRDKSLQLAGRVKHLIIGARLNFDDGTQTEPIKYLGMRPMPAEELGVVYVVGFEVSGNAQFAAPNAGGVPANA